MVESNEDSKTSDSNYLLGRWLSSPLPGEEVVVSGLAGKFPDSHNVQEFFDKLLEKTDLVSEEGRRWKVDHPEIPQRAGNIYDVDKLDAGYFGLHHRHADNMNALMRIILETTIEAILDAGVNPSEIEGTRTAVYASTFNSEMEENAIITTTDAQSFVIIGFMRAFIARRISYFLKLKSISYAIDTACSSFLFALDDAFRSIRSGKCDSAIVCGAHLLLNPGTTLQFFRMGVLSPDGRSKVFDQNANGYVRAETVASVFLQKSKDARRIYAKIINSKVNSDGYKDAGLLFPSALSQSQLMKEIYIESGLTPSVLSFLEAHGTGTTVGDIQEEKSIDSALAQNRKEPLLVGSVKSNMGHSEPISGCCSLAKVILAMQTGKIAPNLNLRQTKEGMKGFEEGRMVPILEVTDLQGDEATVAINNFGFGGSNAHIILRRFNKTLMETDLLEDDLPLLICVSGRTKKAVTFFLNELNSKRVNKEYIALIHQAFKDNIGGHLYRGFTILNQKGSIETSCKLIKHKLPLLYLYFGNLEATVLGKQLLNIPIFETTIKSINNILIHENFNILEAMTKGSEKAKDNAVVAFAVQLGIAVLFTELKLKFTAVYGDSLGKLATAFYYNIITLDEAVLRASTIIQNLSNKNVTREELFSSQIVFNLSKQNKNDIHHNFFNIEDLRKFTKNSVILNVSNEILNHSDLLITDADKLLKILGSLYEQGFNFQITKLYSKIKFPVNTKTSTISPLIKWDHKKSWKVYKHTDFFTSETKDFNVSIFDEEYKYLQGHVIDGRNLIPAAKYLQLVWSSFAENLQMKMKNCSVTFHNCKFIKATTLPKAGYLGLSVMIQLKTGYFEVVENETVVVSGTISKTDTGFTDLNLPNVDLEDNSNKFLEHDEIYRELYLRGYNYSGVFKGLMKCNIEGTYGLIRWEDNWTAFIDKMLQMSILQLDSRMLFVPVSIEKLIIHPIGHLVAIQTLKADDILLPVYTHHNVNIIKSGGVEIKNLQAKSIARRQEPIKPVLEKYEFIPNVSILDISQAIRTNTQIILENNLKNDFKAVEIIDDYTEDNAELLLPHVCNTLDDIPLVSPNLTISTKKIIEEIPGIKIDNVMLTPKSNFLLIVGTNILKRPSMFKTIIDALNTNGFLLTRENLNFKFQSDEQNKILELFTEYTTGKEKLILLKKRSQKLPKTEYVQIDDNFLWLPSMQNALKKEGTEIVIYGKNTQPNGILGLINAIRREPDGSRIKCFFTLDPDFNFDVECISQNTQMAINIYKDFIRGTYRHLLLENLNNIDNKHCFVNSSIKGNLSSLKWFEGPLSKETPLSNDQVLVYTNYSALNFKDVMFASGRIGIEYFIQDRIEQECGLGFEYSGRDINGKKMAGFLQNKGLSTMVVGDKNFSWTVPENWSMEDAATVPVVYATVAYALLIILKLKPGVSILIHSATGGIGLAAINVCRHFGCDIYLTIGTEEKKEYITKNFPEIPDNHIGNSHDTSFEDMINQSTNGRGVDIVLNSLTEDKLQASIRCLARGGHFIEIGKFDLVNNTSLNLLFLEKEITYHGVMLDEILSNSQVIKKQIYQVVDEGIRVGYMKPLPRVAFKMDEIEQAFRYMTTGKHIGKVLIKIRDEVENIPLLRKKFSAVPRFNCDLTKTYVIIGGLGGFGLELADWLILRGARKLLLSSRTDIQTGYQSQRIRIWKSYGVTVDIATDDVTTKAGCIDLIQKANNLGPVDAVFNLAAILEDALFDNQTLEMYKTSLAPKSLVIKFLDIVTRTLCPQLRHFVAFSSVSCGRGNAGQTNYAMANSIMERICEHRKSEGLPGLAIQWGAIGEVGLVAKMQKENKELVIGGTLQQRVSSCLDVLNTFLCQNYPVVSSMVVALKNNRSLGILSAVDAIATILGITNIKTANQQATLAELGMDSMMGTEIIQVLEKDFEIYVTSREVRSLTLAKLGEIEAEKMSGDKTVNKTVLGINSIIQYIPDTRAVNSLSLVKMASQVEDNEKAPTVFVFPGIEGVLKPLQSFTEKFKSHVFGIQYKYEMSEHSAKDLASSVMQIIESHVAKDGMFNIIGYSFGVDVGLEVVHLLESKGYNGRFLAIEGSPTYLSSATKTVFPTDNETQFETTLLCAILKILLPETIIIENKEQLLKCQNFTQRTNLALSLIPSDVTHKDKLDVLGATTIYNRLKAIIKYEFTHTKIKANVHLLKCKFPLVGCDDDYGFSKICENTVNVTVLDGDHNSILNNSKLVDALNIFFQSI